MAFEALTWIYVKVGLPSSTSLLSFLVVVVVDFKPFLLRGSIRATACNHGYIRHNHNGG